MKRFTSIVVALLLLITMAVSVTALESPTPKQYYNITTSAEGSGTCTASVNKVEKNTDGTVTLTANQDKGYFTRWIFREGEYEILDGKTLSDPVITIIPRSDIDVTASFSVEENYLNMFVEVDTPGNGTAEVDIPKVLKGSDTQVTFTANEADDEFIEWEFFCEYTIVSGDLKSKTITIIPYTDIHGVAHFKQGAQPPKPDDSDTSPKTGDPAAKVLPFMILALCAAFVATRKLTAK